MLRLTTAPGALGDVSTGSLGPVELATFAALVDAAESSIELDYVSSVAAAATARFATFYANSTLDVQAITDSTLAALESAPGGGGFSALDRAARLQFLQQALASPVPKPPPTPAPVPPAGGGSLPSLLAELLELLQSLLGQHPPGGGGGTTTPVPGGSGGLTTPIVLSDAQLALRQIVGAALALESVRFTVDPYVEALLVAAADGIELDPADATPPEGSTGPLDPGAALGSTGATVTSGTD